MRAAFRWSSSSFQALACSARLEQEAERWEADRRRLLAERDEALQQLGATQAEQMALQQELAQAETARDEMEHDLYQASTCLKEAPVGRVGHGPKEVEEAIARDRHRL